MKTISTLNLFRIESDRVAHLKIGWLIRRCSEGSFCNTVTRKETKKEFIAVAEAGKFGIPVIALANTDCNIKNIDFPIIANDASVSSIAFFIAEIVKSYKAGKIAKA